MQIADRHQGSLVLQRPPLPHRSFNIAHSKRLAEKLVPALVVLEKGRPRRVLKLPLYAAGVRSGRGVVYRRVVDENGSKFIHDILVHMHGCEAVNTNLPAVVSAQEECELLHRG